MNKFTNYFVLFLTCFISFKHLRILISKYFGFYFFKARLSSVEGLLAFNVIALISIFGCSLPAASTAAMMLYYHSPKD